MSLSLVFWVLMLVWAVFGIAGPRLNLPPVGNTILLFVLLGLLGWRVFGAAIQG